MSARRADDQQATARWKAKIGRSDLDARRSFVTDCLLLVAVALGVVAIVDTILHAMQEPQRWFLAVPLLGGCGLLLLLVLLRHRISHRLRAWGLLLTGYLAAALFMDGLGSLGNGVLLLAVLPALALVLLGRYSALASAVLSVLVYAGFSGAAAMGILAAESILRVSSWDLTPWLPLGLAAGLVLVALLLLAQVMRVQSLAPEDAPVVSHDSEAPPVAEGPPTVGRDPEAVTAVEASPAVQPGPEEAMVAEASPAVRHELAETARNRDHYARLLEAAAEISRQVLRVRKSEALLREMVDLLVDRMGFQHAAVYLVESRLPRAERALPPARQPELPVPRAVPGPFAGGHLAGLQAGDRSGSSVRVPEPVARLVEGAAGAQRVLGGAEVISGEGGPPQILLPLRAGGALLAILHVVGSPAGVAGEATAWRVEELAALEVMADHLAVALENAQIFERSETRLQGRDALQRHYTTEAWERLIEGRGRAAYRWIAPVPVSEAIGPAGRSAATETSADGLTEDVWRSLCARVWAEGRPTSLLHEDSGQHVLAMPVRLRDVMVGVLGFRRPREAGSWQQAEIAAIEGVASRMAFAAENLRLLDEAQRRAAHEQALSQVTAHFARSLNMDTVLRAAVRELGRLPDVAEASVYIGGSDLSARAREDEEVQDL